MLELKKITKEYKTEEYTQKALNDVSINFRKNEFASILGPSGSGKTTLLNIIGGLDQYDSGDLIINNVSTKKYKDRDWDSYRNHRVGFVFQSYNLIYHQSVLSNVELALTLSGVSKEERRKRALKALKEVGLKDHVHKKPSQLSGGQMQRVAIARALVNDPEILLADEPTGALDTNTSKQIMDILKKIAKDRLVIMVTHNPDIAEEYSNRIIKLLDGKIIDDTNPYNEVEEVKKEDNKKKTKKTQMSFKTALGLSLNNLMTKKGRTILTAFAGSIGIIGIALILSLSDGVNNYITSIQRETMLSYPITIQSKAMDLTSFLQTGKEVSEGTKETKHKKDAVYTNGSLLELASTMTTNIYENNLKKFKEYLDNKDSEINKYVGNNGIIYNYQTKFNIFSYDQDNILVNSDGSTFLDTIESSETLGQVNDNIGDGFQDNLFTELLPDKDGKGISKAVKEEYEIVKGEWPKEYNEVVLIVDRNNEISATNLYYLGFLPSKNYKEILKSLENSKDFSYDSEKITYKDILNKEFYLLTETDYYIRKDNGNYESVKKNSGKVQELVKQKSLKLKVVGIIRQKEESKNMLVDASLAYTKELTNWMIQHVDDSEVVIDQINNPETNVLSGLKFSVSSNEEKIEEAKKYLKNLGVSDKAKLITLMLQQQNSAYTSQMMNMDEVSLASFLDRWLQSPDNDVLISVYDNYMSSGSYNDNMNNFGHIEKERPTSISIYADTFEDKDGITKSIENYNKKQKEEDKITYTDYVGLLMSSVTTIINAITYVLIAFVSISLIVSSIMIAIITYISVLERTKEIGILRAIGASKKDISRVFKAETFIEGAVAGIIGIMVTVLLNIPINMVIYSLTDIEGLSHLPITGALGLIIISIILTVIAGLIPSHMAAKKDPVESLRSE
ncbi:MAG: ABC transporter ATP-binding protein/permease [Bacilli bacterium]|nr:ABC transporter ATP-binding protein/permease [Bacilli bacterium]